VVVRVVVVGAVVVRGRETTVDGAVVRREFAFPDRLAFERALRLCLRAWCLRRSAGRAGAGAAAAVRCPGAAPAGLSADALRGAIDDVLNRPERQLTANAIRATTTSPTAPATSQTPVGPSQACTRLTIRLSVSVRATIADDGRSAVQRPCRAYVKPM
jgi:hypothetical protein